MKHWTRNIGLVTLATIVVLPALALAQSSLPDPANIGEFLRAALAAVQGGQWSTVGVLVLIAAVWALRKFATKIPAGVGEFFGTSEGGAVLAFLAAGVASLAGAVYAGSPLSWPLALAAGNAAFLAIGGWVGSRRLLRLFVPLVAKIPGVGVALSNALAWLCGADQPDPAPSDPSQPVI